MTFFFFFETESRCYLVNFNVITVLLSTLELSITTVSFIDIEKNIKNPVKKKKCI